MTDAPGVPSGMGDGSVFPRPAVTAVAAVARNGVIGNGPVLPWYLPAELAHFKAVTMGGTLIMGRTTFEGIGRVLPGRETVVLTTSLGWAHPGVTVAGSSWEALDVAASTGRDVFVVGGRQTYEALMPWVTRLCISRVDQDAVGDVMFPKLKPGQWELVDTTPGDGFTVEKYHRTY